MSVAQFKELKVWVPSRFNVPVDLARGRKAVFNTASATLVKIDQATWRESLAPGARHRSDEVSHSRQLELLRSRGLIVPQDVDEIDSLRLRFLTGRFASHALNLYVTPTLACNLRCGYCFEGLAQSRVARKGMDRRTENAVVRYIATQACGRESVGITWFGGEPLLALPAIERMSRLLVPAFRKVGIRYSATILTNGTLVDRKAAAVLKRSRVSGAQVTVDVPSSERRDRLGLDTLDRALDGAALLAETLNVTLRVNVCRDDEGQFQLLYEGLLRRKLHLRLRAIDFSQVVQPECGRGLCLVLMGHQAYTAVLDRERNRARSLGLPAPILHLRSQGPCMAVSHATAVVGPDGALWKCPEDIGLAERSYGSVFDDEVNPSNLVPWLTYDWFAHRECEGCSVLPQCAGGCPHRRLFPTHAPAPGENCFWFMRGNLEDRIRLRANVR